MSSARNDADNAARMAAERTQKRFMEISFAHPRKPDAGEGGTRASAGALVPARCPPQRLEPDAALVAHACLGPVSGLAGDARRDRGDRIACIGRIAFPSRRDSGFRSG
jgi:hypothetical protein